MKRNGVVLELDKDRAIVINSEGRYIIIRRTPRMFVGEEIQFESSQVINLKKRMISGALAVMSAAAIIVVVILLNINLSKESNIYAFIDVDINPSIELYIDKNHTVIKTHYLNEDAKKLLKNTKVNGLNINEAVLEIVEISKIKGFLSSSQENVVYISASLNVDMDDSDRFIATQEIILQSILTDIEISLDTSQASGYIIHTEKILPEARQEAKNNKLSMGKYSLFTKIQEQGLNMTIEEIKEKPVSYVLNRIKDSDEITHINKKELLDSTNTQKEHNNEHSKPNDEKVKSSDGKKDKGLQDSKNDDSDNDRKDNETNMDGGKEPQNNGRKPENVPRESSLRDEEEDKHKTEFSGNETEDPRPSNQPNEANQGKGKPDEVNQGKGHQGESSQGKGNQDEDKSAEGKPVEIKPGEGKPVEIKLGEGKPVEIRPGEGKPDEMGPSERKPDQGNSNEDKPNVLDRVNGVENKDENEKNDLE